MHRHVGDLWLLAPSLILVAAAGTAYGFILRWTIDGLQAGRTEIGFWGPLAILAATGARFSLADTGSGAILRDPGAYLARARGGKVA